jgi:FixJ family two-component response regulator
MFDSRLRISIVDDEQSVRKALRRLLGSAGFHVETFASGCEFLNSLGKLLPDCVILDLDLAGLSGLEIQQQLRERSLKLPIIIITGRDDPGLGQRVRAAGAAACLYKPVDERVLLEAISSATCAGHAAQEPSRERRELPTARPTEEP